MDDLEKLTAKEAESRIELVGELVRDQLLRECVATLGHTYLSGVMMQYYSAKNRFARQNPVGSIEVRGDLTLLLNYVEDKELYALDETRVWIEQNKSQK
jgi:hypothetical protein